jgi:hypothetical protein
MAIGFSKVKSTCMCGLSILRRARQGRASRLFAGPLRTLGKIFLLILRLLVVRVTHDFENLFDQTEISLCSLQERKDKG